MARAAQSVLDNLQEDELDRQPTGASVMAQDCLYYLSVLYSTYIHTVSFSSAAIISSALDTGLGINFPGTRTKFPDPE